MRAEQSSPVVPAASTTTGKEVANQPWPHVRPVRAAELTFERTLPPAGSVAATASSYHRVFRLHGPFLFTPDGGGSSGMWERCMRAAVYFHAHKSELCKNPTPAGTGEAS